MSLKVRTNESICMTIYIAISEKKIKDLARKIFSSQCKDESFAQKTLPYGVSSAFYIVTKKYLLSQSVDFFSDSELCWLEKWAIRFYVNTLQ